MVKKIAAFFLLLSLVIAVSARQTTNLVLKKQSAQIRSDTARVKVLNELAQACQESNVDRSMKYATQALVLSDRAGWAKGKAISCRQIGICYYLKSHPDSALACFEKSLQIARQIKDTTLMQDALNDLDYVYSDGNACRDFDKALSIRLQSLALYKKSGDNKGVLKLLMKVGEAYVYSGNNGMAIQYWLDAANLKKQTNDTAYLFVYRNIAIAYKDQSRWQEAIQYFKMGVEQSMAQNDKVHAGQLLRLMAQCYQSEHDFANAFKTFDTALSIFRQKNESYERALVLNNIGLLYTDRQDYPNAIRYLLLSLAIGESINSKELNRANANALSISYIRIHDYDTALSLLLKAAVLFEELKATDKLGEVYRNISAIYRLLGQKENADYYTRKSFQSAFRSNSPQQKALDLNNIGIGYVKSGMPAEGFSMLQQALQMSRQNKDTGIIAMVLGNTALAWLSLIERNELQKLPKQLQFSTTYKHFNYIISLADTAVGLDTLIHDLNLLQAHYALLSATYKLKKDYRQALLNYEKHILYRDSLFNGEKMKRIGRLESQLEINKRDSLINQAAFENKIQRGKNRITATILLCLLAAAFVTFYFLGKRRKYKFQLRLLQVELQASEAKQEALNAQMSDHFVGNAMHSIKIFIDNNDKENAILYLDRFRQLTRRVIQNASQQLVDLKEDLKVLEDYILLEKLRFTDGTFSYDIIIDPRIDTASVEIPPMILQVVTENAIKHGFRKSLGGKLTIEITKENNTLHCRVQDNGIGRKAAAHSKREDAPSYGTPLAERLIRLSSNNAAQTSYNVTDLYDTDGLPIGTRVEITLPFLLKSTGL